GGSCDVFCASNLKYALKEHGDIQSIPPLWKCLEGKESFECHPSANQVLGLFESYKKLGLTQVEASFSAPRITASFNDGARIEIHGGDLERQYDIWFFDQGQFPDWSFSDINLGQAPNKLQSELLESVPQSSPRRMAEYITSSTTNSWASSSRRTYVDWALIVKSSPAEGKNIEPFYHEEVFSAKNKPVLITFESKSVGDSIAWMPYVEEFRTKHECKMFCQTFHNEFFKDVYPDINFISFNEVVDTYASYKLGWFGDWEDKNFNPTDPREMPLQYTAPDILGLEKRELRPPLEKKERPRHLVDRYVCISTASTAGLKHWQNESGWQLTVNYLNEKGYKVVVLQQQPLDWMDLKGLKNIIHPIGADLEEAAEWMQHCEFFIGLGSGMSWLAWALKKPVILISGFSLASEEFYTPYRVINTNVCHGCWNSMDHKFDKGNWNWCPKHEGTDRHFECSKAITFEMVKEAIEDCFLSLWGENNLSALGPWKLDNLTISLNKAKEVEGKAAEVGVYKGGSARKIASTLDDRDLLLFDTFEGMPETGFEEPHKKGDFNDTSLESVKSYLSDKPNCQFFPGFFPNTAEHLKSEVFSFVHLDGDYYETTKNGIEFFYPRLAKGGIILFDDYGWDACPGVRKAIDEFFVDKQDEIEAQIYRAGDDCQQMEIKKIK
ncbi:MAG TPA: autotransporter strand-loop-strand O-heptosyltransferase, partial [Maribacter sp.]|nr:autotransporter strand-loop-strand O-heptosyltransferase [Maribacter sp.]